MRLKDLQRRAFMLGKRLLQAYPLMQKYIQMTVSDTTSRFVFKMLLYHLQCTYSRHPP